MPTIYLMRHGYAEKDNPGGDEARELTERGHELVQVAARVLARLETVPTRILCSPRVRAQQTAQHVGEALNITPEVRESVNFNFEVDVVREAIIEFPDDALMFVGHEPTMSEVLGSLSGAAVVMKPGTTACLELKRKARHGALAWLLPPQLAVALGT